MPLVTTSIGMADTFLCPFKCIFALVHKIVNHKHVYFKLHGFHFSGKNSTFNISF